MKIIAYIYAIVLFILLVSIVTVSVVTSDDGDIWYQNNGVITPLSNSFNVSLGSNNTTGGTSFRLYVAGTLFAHNIYNVKWANISGQPDFFDLSDISAFMNNWNTSYGWGDHSIQNYFDTDTDLLDEPLLDCDNAPTDEYVLTYESGTGNFEWQQDQTGGGEHQDQQRDRNISWKGHNHSQDLNSTSAVTFTTVNTGHGANELYDMNQNVQSTDIVTFAAVNTGLGNNELYDMNQNVQTTDNVVFNFLEIASTNAEVRADGTTTAKFRLEQGPVPAYMEWYLDVSSNMRFALGGTTNIFVSAVSGHVGLAGDVLPTYGVEAPNIGVGVSGSMRADAFTPYSDNRQKFFLYVLPEEKVLKLCRLIGWWLYNPIETWQDEEGNIFFGNRISEIVKIGTSAQHLYTQISNEFSENVAEQLVFKPENENKDYWSVDYDKILMIYARGWQINDKRITDLEQAVYG